MGLGLRAMSLTITTIITIIEILTRKIFSRIAVKIILMLRITLQH